MSLFEEIFAEIRSLLNSTSHTLDHETLRTHYETLWAQDKERTENELDPYLLDYFEQHDAFPSLSFEQYGSEPMPREWRPLFDRKRLDLAPYTKFARSLSYSAIWRDYAPGYEYDSGDPYEDSSPSYWMPWEDLPWSPIARQFRRMELNFEGLCEGRDNWNDQYIVPRDAISMFFKFMALESFSILCAKRLIGDAYGSSETNYWSEFLLAKGFDAFMYSDDPADPINALPFDEQDRLFRRLQTGDYDLPLQTLDLGGCLLDASEDVWVTALKQKRFANLERLTLSMPREAPRQKLTALAKERGIALQIRDYYIPPR